VVRESTELAVRVVSLPDLVAMKRASGREQDLAEPERAPARHRLIDTFLSAPEAQLDAPAMSEAA
jgi:hypothetical protein